MQVTERKQGEVLVLELTGRLDAATSGAFEERVLALIGGGTQRVVIDAAKLDYVSSAGLRVFLIAAKRLAPPAGRFAIAALQPQVREVLDIAGFSNVLSLHANLADAVQAAT